MKIVNTLPSFLTKLQRKFFQSVSSQYVSYMSAEMSGATKPSSICSRGVFSSGNLERVRQAMVATSNGPACKYVVSWLALNNTDGLEPEWSNRKGIKT